MYSPFDLGESKARQKPLLTKQRAFDFLSIKYRFIYYAAIIKTTRLHCVSVCVSVC